MNSTQKNFVAVGGVTISGIDGNQEEVIELKDLLDEVLDGAYNGNKKAFKADFATVIGNNQCYKCDQKICRELFEAVEKWANGKMRLLKEAEDFLEAIDIDEAEPGESDGLPGADAWSKTSTYNRTGLEIVKNSHSPHRE